MDRITSIDAWLLKLPLERPYRLAFGPVTEFDTLIIGMRLQDGSQGFGEATLLTGYTDETIDGTWRRASQILETVDAAPRRGSPPERQQLAPMLDALDASHPFLTTAFRTAFEMAAGSPLLRAGDASVSVPILGLLQGESFEDLAGEAERLLAEGYATLKVKVGFDPVRDAAIVAAAQRAVHGRALIRLDANQGYTAREASDFVARVAPDGIELFEQPCRAGDWAAHMHVANVARSRGLPLMLDESIYSLREIEHAASLGAAQFIKVKLMKFNSVERLDAAVGRIQELGLQPVLGNGVATELSCWMEACVAARRIRNAGEMNGFLKPRERLFEQPLPFREGAIELPAGFAPTIDTERLSRMAIAHRSARLAGPSNPSAASPNPRSHP
jgi:L-alanine-DL-glutamate epimerase-like enolase superfamily enzyme